MENSKTPRKYSAEWYNTFLFDQDTRYYGVFMKGEDETRHILIDPIRYQKKFNISDDKLKKNMKDVMSKRRHGPLFRPTKKGYLDYNINIVTAELMKIRMHWERDLKPLINRILSEICGKQFVSGDGGDYELLHSGIIDHEEAMERAMMKTQLSKHLAESKKNELYASLYSQYFHQLASQIEGVILKILTRNGYADETFSRKQFYKFRPDLEEEVHGLKGHTEFDKLYTIWCFLKHNSLPMYKALKEKFTEVLKKETYEQGEMAWRFVELSDDLIESILTGIERFLIEYCHLVFGENELEARWNSEEHFYKNAISVIRAEQDPMGINEWWD
jgi:hypothetical protein